MAALRQAFGFHAQGVEQGGHVHVFLAGGFAAASRRDRVSRSSTRLCMRWACSIIIGRNWRVTSGSGASISARVSRKPPITVSGQSSRDIGDKVAVHQLHAVQLGDVTRDQQLAGGVKRHQLHRQHLLHRLAEPQDQRLAVVLRQQVVMKAGLAHQIGHHIAHVSRLRSS